jgi:glycosyltransferase involved in cell wall biosynthesis
MRLLLVFQHAPYPPDDGGRIGFWNPIKYLSRRHDVHIAFLGEDDDRKYSEVLAKHCASVHALFRSAPGGIFPLVGGLVGHPPGTTRKFWDPRFMAIVKQVVQKHDIELVEFHNLHTAIYREAAGELPTILRAHNIEHILWKRHSRRARLVERFATRLVARRIERYEAATAELFDRVVVISPADAGYLRSISPTARIEVIPSGVDTEYFCPDVGVPEEPNRMVLSGGFAWRPKQHNLRVILEQIMPRIRAKAPDARLSVVGKGMPPYLEKLAARTPGVDLIGAVPDVRPYVRAASFSLNYVEIGSGIALKILEAQAMRKPVLSNTLGCEGIAVEHNREVFLADGPDNFAEAAALLLRNAALRQRLANAGYEFVRRRYAWEALAGDFDGLYGTLNAEKKRQQDSRIVRC